MSKSKLLVAVALCAFAALAKVRADEPRDESDTIEVSAEATAVQSQGSAQSGIVVLAKTRKPGPRFENVAIDATPENRWLHEMLSKPIPPLDFPGETPLSEILDSVSAYYTTTFGAGAGPDGGGFRMTIYPDRAELDLEGITSLEDVTVSDISFEGMRLDNALKLIFDQTTDPELTYVIENQVLKVTTLAKAESEDNFVTRVYNVGELADIRFRTRQASHLRFFSLPSQSSTERTAPPTKGVPKELTPSSDLESLILEMTSPSAKWFAIDGEGGSLRLIDHLLFVRQKHVVQEHIVLLLNLLDRDSTYETRIYKVSDLADLRSSVDQVYRTRVFKSTSSDSSDTAPVKPKPNPVADSNLESLIIEMTGRNWATNDGEGGAIRRIGQHLVIRQTAAVHGEIVDLLELLEEIDESGNESAH